MANIIREQKLVDNEKRALLKYVITSDGSVETNALLVDVSMLRYALNTNNQLLNTASNANIRTSYATTIRRIFGSMRSSGGYIKILWDGSNNDADIVSFGGGPFDYNFDSMGGSAAIGNPQANSNGDILITTAGLTANDVATVFIDMKKDNRFYASGQFSDPDAFNNERIV